MGDIVVDSTSSLKRFLSDKRDVIELLVERLLILMHFLTNRAMHKRITFPILDITEVD